MPDRRPRRYRLRGADELEPAQLELYNRIVGGPRGDAAATVPIVDGAGALIGPFGPMTLAPAVGEAVQQLGAALRFRLKLSPRVREAAILLVASYRDSEFERFAHTPPGAAAGLDESQLEALAAGSVPDGLDPAETTALEAVRLMLITGSLDDDAYATSIAALGEATVAELVWLTGYYSMIALSLAVFDPPNPLANE